MKFKKIFQKAAAVVMAAVTVFSVLPATTAFAAVGDVGTISFSHTYDGNGNAMRYNSSANINGYIAGGTGDYKYRMFVDGDTAFCLQPGVPLKTGNTLKEASSEVLQSRRCSHIVVLLGCAVSLFGGGGNSNAYTPVSAEVEAYAPLIRQYASQHGIPEYVELIKAVMMQESGGRGNDPMQASECGYNTRYPNTPNGITDPEYSIDVGIQNLADCLNAAEVENPVDMEHIKLALQGYNFGNGYISWAKNNYGGYSYANAVEFSAIQAERLGWDSYGDTQYVAHVLRYYPYGRAFTSGGNQAIVEVALTQLGNVGGEPYWSWYGFDSRVEWCACFVSWCAEQCGYLESGIIPKYSLCSDGVNGFGTMDNGKVGIMSRQQAISSSLTGREMVQSTTQGSWRKAKMVQFIPLRVTLGMNVSREVILSEAA